MTGRRKMCSRCDNKAVSSKWKWWVGVTLSLAIFISSQLFMYGKVFGVIETHIKNDPTFKQLTEVFVTKDEFKTIKEMILYLYQKEGGL